MRFNMLCVLLTVALFVVPLACTMDGEDVEEQTKPPCTDDIEDEDYEGSYRVFFGFGEGVLPAMRAALSDPEQFNVLVAMNGPTSLARVAQTIAADLADFDNWPDEVDRVARIRTMRDWLAAYGNVFVENPDSHFCPPGVEASDFRQGRSVTLPALIGPENPNGLYPSVTVYDASGEPVDFVLAHDLNENGKRDAGEPLILRFREPFDDDNDNGRYDNGESYDDVGLDGVAGTGDTGEGNGEFDRNPRYDAWTAADPWSLIEEAELDLEPGYHHSMYLESLADGQNNYADQIERLAETLGDNLDGTGDGPFCIADRLGRYDTLSGEQPFFTERFWFAEKAVWMQPDLAAGDFWADTYQYERAWRLNQALRFVSLRMPNGLFDIQKESRAIWQVRSFPSEALGRYVDFGILFPAGYFDEISNWKTYPIVYLFHGREGGLNQWRNILLYQGDLARRELAKQVLIVVVDGQRAADQPDGFHHYVNQAATEFGGAYGDMVDELVAHVETTFRVQVEDHDRDDDDD